MVSTEDFCKVLKEQGYDYFSGVPCSILTSILDYMLKDSEIIYIPAVRENVALGIASGAYLAGRRSGILIQNSGLGNIINGLTSFNIIYKIPVLMFITWRGYQGKDAPEHLIMGEKTTSLLKELDIPTVVLSENFKDEINWAIDEMNNKLIPSAVILKKGIVG